MTLEDQVLVELHRAASLAGRPGIAVPSLDLAATTERIGHQQAHDALRRLARAGRVRSVRHNLWVLPDTTGRLTVELADLIKVVTPPLHLITGGRALEQHHLTNQHAFVTFVLVPRQLRGFSFAGERVRFVTTKAERIWGWQKRGPHFALPERAILDAVSSSRYGVSLSMAVAALHIAAESDPKFLNRLVKAAGRFDSPVVSRRLGLLVDRLYGSDAALPFHDLIGTSRTPVPLRPGGARDGVVDPKWKVLVNASTDVQRVNA